MAAAPDGEIDRGTVLAYTPRINWESYLGQGKGPGGALFLEPEDVRCIKRFVTEDAEALTELLATDADARRYPHSLLKVMTNVTDPRLLQYAALLMDDFISHDPATRTRYVTRPGSTDRTPFIVPLLMLVGAPGVSARYASADADPFVLERAASAAAQALATDTCDAAATSSMMAWVMSNIKPASGPVTPKQARVTEVAVAALKKLMRSEFLRRIFLDEAGVQRLNMLLSSRNTQVLYDAVFCLWTLSLTPAARPQLERAGSVTAVSHLVRTGAPLKLLRVSVATLANVAKDAECGDTLAELAETHVPGVVEALLGGDPKPTDPEFLDDLTYLDEALRSNKRTLTSVERYEKALAARRLEWSATHTSEWWKENVLRMEAGEFRLVQALGDLLKDGGVDDTTLAVALFDLGEFAVNHPQGRNVLQHLGLRPVVMAYLKREDEEVRSQALLAVSKMMLTKWQFVGGAGGGAAGTPRASPVSAKA